jgi:hypothetical protein
MRRHCFLVVSFVLLAMVPFSALPYGQWKKIAVTEQKDYWYVDQILSFASKGHVLTSRALLKCVPGEGSAVAQNLRRGLIHDGVGAERFSHFVESVEVDCAQRRFAISGIWFYDFEGALLREETFSKPKMLIAAPGSVFEAISWDLCLDKPGFFDIVKDTLKKKKPFLYFYPQ